nr:hypothetical protein [Tanacetum cinerariifolium]
MEGNKSIQRSDEQRNLYKALVKAYESDKEGKEPESASAPMETATMSTGIILNGFLNNRNHQLRIMIGIRRCRLPTEVETFTPELLAGPTYELIKGSCKSMVELEYHLEEVFKATIDQLDWVNPEGQQYPYNLLKPLLLIPNTQGRRVIPFEHFINNDLEYLHGGASSRKDDDKLYKFKEGDFKRLRIQDIEDMLLLLIQGKLTNLTVKERFAFNSIWRKSDKDRAVAMIQAIDKRLKTRRIMRSLERFVKGRLYEGDFRMLQRTI